MIVVDEVHLEGKPGGVGKALSGGQDCTQGRAIAVIGGGLADWDLSVEAKVQ